MDYNENNFNHRDGSYDRAILDLEYHCKNRLRENEEDLRRELDMIETDYKRHKKHIEENYKSELEAINSNSKRIIDYDDSEDKNVKKRISEQRDNDLKRAKEEYSYQKKRANINHNETKKRIKLECDEERKNIKKNFKKVGASGSSKQLRFSKTLLFALIVLGVFLIILSNNKTKQAKIKIKILDNLETTLEVKQETAYFVTNKIPVREYVKSSVGDYYKINLKLADTIRERVQFPTGLYYMEKDKDELLNSISEFKSRIYNIIDENLESQIFIKGTADLLGDTTFSSALVSPYDESNGFKQIRFYPKDRREDVYINSYETYKIGDSLYNKDLPILRAKFLQKLFIDSEDDLSKPIILEGNVSDFIDEKERNAFLILYVNWESLKEEVGYGKLFFIGLALSLISFLILLYLILKK